MCITNFVKISRVLYKLNGRILRQNGDLKAYLFVFRERTRLMEVVTNIYVNSVSIFLAVTKYIFSE
jgi:hypothetical protein